MLVYNYHVEFLTATILRWQHLLADDAFKSVITESLGWLALQERCKIYGFVIMPNHIHLLWQINNRLARREVQGALLSFTAHRFKEQLEEVNKRKLYNHFVGDADRRFQFWERDAMVKECWSETFLLQKLLYIHHNPCQPHWSLAIVPENYRWSSAAFYQLGKSEFEWLRHYAM